jgi:EcsC protein family
MRPSTVSTSRGGLSKRTAASIRLRREDAPEDPDATSQARSRGVEVSLADDSNAPVQSQDEEPVGGLPDGLWERLLADPSRAPQYLALAATERWGAQARTYAEKIRQSNPDATADELASLVKRRHATLARMEGAAAGLPATIPVYGLVGAAATMPADLAALAWIQSRMVVHIAAVYGHDTSDTEMAAELLVLQGLYNSTDAARVALVEASKRVSTRLINQYVKGSTLVLLRQLFKTVGIKFTRTGLLKAVPFVAVPLSAGVNEFSTRSLGNRAIEFYRTSSRA